MTNQTESILQAIAAAGGHRLAEIDDGEGFNLRFYGFTVDGAMRHIIVQRVNDGETTVFAPLADPLQERDTLEAIARYADPNNEASKYDAIELSTCVEHEGPGDEIGVEVAHDRDEIDAFFADGTPGRVIHSVYWHLRAGHVNLLADCATMEDARTIAAALSIAHRLPVVDQLVDQRPQPGDVVKYSRPEEGERDLRFTVIETAYDAIPRRVTIRAIDPGSAIPGIEVVQPIDIERVQS